MNKRYTIFILAIIIAVLSLSFQDLFAKSETKAKNVKQNSPVMDKKWEEKNKRVIELLNEKKIDEALKLAEEILEYLKSSNKTESAEIATAYNNVGMLNLQMGKITKAEQYLWKAADIRQKIFGPTNVEVAIVWQNLARLYKIKAEYIYSLNKKNEKKDASEQTGERKLKSNK